MENSQKNRKGESIFCFRPPGCSEAEPAAFSLLSHDDPAAGNCEPLRTIIYIFQQ